MRTVIKTQNKLDQIVQNNLSSNGRVIYFNNSIGAIWKGAKRYAH
jgi:hypothetical protein